MSDINGWSFKKGHDNSIQVFVETNNRVGKIEHDDKTVAKITKVGKESISLFVGDMIYTIDPTTKVIEVAHLPNEEESS